MSDADARQRIQFAFNADLDSILGETFEYLLKNAHFPTRTGKHKGTDAMVAFWAPFAHQERADVSAEELKAVAHQSIAALTHQIELICETFGIDKPAATTVASLNLRQEIRQVVSEALQEVLVQGVAASATAPTQSAPRLPLMEVTDGVDFDEDALFGDLLDDAAIAA